MGLPPDIEASHPALDEFQREEEKAQQALDRRIGEVEARLVEESSDPARGLALQLADLDRRLAESKAESESRAGTVRAKLSAGPVSQEEFRAQLVMLDMEYASRLRLAEEGLRLLSGGLEQALEAGRSRIRVLVGELRDALRLQVNPSRKALAGAMAQREDQLREKALALEKARGEAEEARCRLRAAEKDRESSEAYQRTVFEARLQESSQAAAEAARRLKDREAESGALEAELAAQRASSAAFSRRLEESERAAGRLDAENRELKERLAAPPAPPPPAPDPAAAEQTAVVLEDAKKAIQSLRSEHEALADRLPKLEAERDEALKTLQEARAGREVLSEKQRRLEVERDEAVRLLQQSRASHEATRSERDALQQTLQSAATKIPEAAERMRALMEDFRKDGARKEQEISRLKQELAVALDQTRPPTASGKPTEETQRRIQAVESELRLAKDEAEQMKAELEAGRAKSRELYKRILEADKARDLSMDERRDLWQAEKVELEDIVAAKTREIEMLKLELEANDRSWQEATARQDAARMQELFKLRAEVQKLKWRLADKLGGPAKPSEPSPAPLELRDEPPPTVNLLWRVGETPPPSTDKGEGGPPDTSASGPASA